MTPCDSSRLQSSQLLTTVALDMYPPRVLIAEDSAPLRGLLAKSLRAEGYDVVDVGDGWELLERLEHQGFDLVLSDIGMPGCSGLQALESLREHDWQTPALLMSAYCDARVEEEAERLGATLLEKPFKLEQLFAQVKAMVSPARYQRGWY